MISTLLGTIVIYNILVVAGFLFLAWGLKKNSIWLSRGFPPALKAAIRPLTDQEKRKSLQFVVPLLALMILVPWIYMGWATLALDHSFLQNWWEGFLILFSFNLVDLVVIDWLIVCFLTPKFLVAPGTEGHPGYKDYGFHFRAALKGTVLVGVLSLVMAALVWGIDAILGSWL